MPNSTKKKTEMNILRYYVYKNGRKCCVLFSVLHSKLLFTAKILYEAMYLTSPYLVQITYKIKPQNAI